GMGMKITESIPDKNDVSFEKSLEYMGCKKGEKLLGKPINYVFIGSCTNSRIEDFRLAAQYIKGKQKAPNVNALIVPGSQRVVKEIKTEGIQDVGEAAGCEIRQRRCAGCLGMNEVKIRAGDYCDSTSNRKFEGRQRQGARTILASPLVGVATASAGNVV